MKKENTLLEIEILKLLKVNYLNALTEIKKDSVPFMADVINLLSQDRIKEPHKYFYYLYALNDNLFESMKPKAYQSYCDGSGSELEFKMKALRSSSAMTYNLFGNYDKVNINGNGFFTDGEYRVDYEKKLKTLKYGGPANLDVLLTKEDGTEIIACEMKMCEWLFNEPGKLKEAYLNQAKYVHPDSANDFIEIAKKLLKKSTSQYDAFQIFKHIIGCYNYCRKNTNITKITLINCVWMLRDPQSIESTDVRHIYEEKMSAEKAEFKSAFDDELLNKIKVLFKKFNPKFDFNLQFIEFYNFSNMISYPILKDDKNQKHIHHKAYIDKRYNF